MDTYWKAAMFTAVMAGSLSAQAVPAVELFGGYSYARSERGEAESAINLHGWNVGITGRVSSWLGFTADASGHYASPSATDMSQFALLAGPTFSLRVRKLHPFVHALGGAVRAHRDVSPPGPVLPQLPPNTEWAFGMALGGGLDVAVSRRVAFRLIQADYLLTRFDESTGIVCAQSILPCAFTKTGTQHNLRLSAGVVFRLGRV